MCDVWQQWYYMFAPGRLLIHERNLSALDLLAVLESSVKHIPAQSQIKKQQPNQQPPQPAAAEQQTQQPVATMMIDFTKLFDEK